MQESTGLTAYTLPFARNPKAHRLALGDVRAIPAPEEGDLGGKGSVSQEGKLIHILKIILYCEILSTSVDVEWFSFDDTVVLVTFFLKDFTWQIQNFATLCSLLILNTVLKARELRIRELLCKADDSWRDADHTEARGGALSVALGRIPGWSSSKAALSLEDMGAWGKGWPVPISLGKSCLAEWVKSECRRGVPEQSIRITFY